MTHLTVHSHNEQIYPVWIQAKFLTHIEFAARFFPLSFDWNMYVQVILFRAAIKCDTQLVALRRSIKRFPCRLMLNIGIFCVDVCNLLLHWMLMHRWKHISSSLTTLMSHRCQAAGVSIRLHHWCKDEDEVQAILCDKNKTQDCLKERPVNINTFEVLVMVEENYWKFNYIFYWRHTATRQLM